MKISSTWTGVTRRQLESLTPPEKKARILDLFEPGQLTVGEALTSLDKKAAGATLLQFAGAGALAGSYFLGLGAIGFGASSATLAALTAVGGISAVAAAVGLVRKKTWLTREVELADQAKRVSAALLTPASPGVCKDSRFLNDGLFEDVHELRDLQTGKILKREAHLRTPVPVKFTEDPEKGRVTLEFNDTRREVEGSLKLPTGEQPLLVLELPPDPRTGDESKQTFAADGTSHFSYLQQKGFYDAPFFRWWATSYETSTQATDRQGGVVDLKERIAFRPLLSTVETGQAVGTQNSGEYVYSVTPVANGSYAEIRGLATGPLQPGKWTQLSVLNIRRAALSASVHGLTLRQDENSKTVTVNGKSIPGELRLSGEVMLESEGVTQRFSDKDTNVLVFSGPTGQVQIHHPKGERPRAELFWASTSRGEVNVAWDGQQYTVEGRVLKPPINLHDLENQGADALNSSPNPGTAG